MHCYRITKYDPKNRNSKGHYMKDEWTSVCEIGKMYNNEEFTISEYLLVEGNYSNAIKNIMTEINVDSLAVMGLEMHDYLEIKDGSSNKVNQLYNSVKEGKVLKSCDVPLVAKLILRENLWAKLVSQELEVHFGYDYYMYVCSRYPLRKVVDQINESGLFVESMRSPYL
ncbi:hypothetical protein ACTXNW_18440 [Enterococcus malodoratus]|uniref:hypothetical protein n=1 Tax=Enterococcus malodoratus TaxID=71451 RepID=UPI003FD1995A